MPDTAQPSRTRVCLSAASHFETGLRPFFAYRDLGVKDASRGGHTAHIIRAVPGQHAQAVWHWHELDFQFVLVLKGWVRFEYEDIGEVLLQQGDSVYQPPRVKHREMAHSEDLELLEVTSPGEFPTHMVDGPARAG